MGNSASLAKSIFRTQPPPKAPHRGGVGDGAIVHRVSDGVESREKGRATPPHRPDDILLLR